MTNIAAIDREHFSQNETFSRKNVLFSPDAKGKDEAELPAVKAVQS